MSFPSLTAVGGFTAMVSVMVQPDKLDEFLGSFWPLAEQCTAQPECLRFELLRRSGEPNKLMSIETWSKSQEWFMETHRSRAPVQQAIEALKTMSAGPGGREVYEMIGGDWAFTHGDVYKKL